MILTEAKYSAAGTVFIAGKISKDMGVSKNRGTTKWMVYNGKLYFLMDDLGGKPHYFWKHP